eukprot:365053-Chlamydomonas_euryale.AAC.16
MMVPRAPNQRARCAMPCRYVFNIVFNILNKSALNSFPCPWFISTLQLGERGDGGGLAAEAAGYSSVRSRGLPLKLQATAQ